MSALICGSFAYDSIMVFPDKFKNHILPDQVHILNVSFMVPQMRREYGGCAGNIAYTLNLLGGEGKPMGTVGIDFSHYADWMDKNGIARDYVQEVPGFYTAQAFITTDEDDNQITAFHPGAMGEAHRNMVPESDGVSIGLVSPDGRQGMIDHASQFVQAGIPFMFDPGQGMPMFDGEDLLTFVDQATWVALNSYEAKLLEERTGTAIAELANRVKAIVVTSGSKGSAVYLPGNEKVEIPVVNVDKPIDPTGCGDAYRAGLIYGLMNDHDWQTTGRIAALCGAIKVEHAGTQNHKFTPEEFHTRYTEHYGEGF